MGANLVSLNVNPCKMCMPMGAVTAFYGIKKCMTILHGSQGCSTYIRRHMSTHYNEPVDIASSSLTEQGTVFGGASNLIKGLENLIALYHPEVIGVATTCLAETIGEDVPGIIRDFCDSHPDSAVKIIPVASAGYSGTQYEGFFRALRAVVSHVEMDRAKNHKINIITGILSPADTRYLKKLLDSLGLDYILLPDLSENLDGVHMEVYDRLPGGGTELSDIAKMAGARVTVELSAFLSRDTSPAEYLYETYGVPFIRMNPPVGLRDTDAFIKELVKYGGVVPEELRKERGRYVDAMVDSHKYCAEGRAAVFGEPDFVHSVVRLCCENGVMPVVAATGSDCPALKSLLRDKIAAVGKALFVDRYSILNDADFDVIEQHIVSNGANLMIGSSDGRRIEERTGIPLLRYAFPIHDRVGGQRLRMLGYEGSLQLLDRIANTMLRKKETGFRKEVYGRYYREEKQAEVKPMDTEKTARELAEIAKEKTDTHPCYSCGAGKYARIHLPVAPRCNISCNYCLRKYDCPNESRPGVTTEVLSPEEAFEKYKVVKSKMENLKVVGIAGPGDSLADFENTRKTLELIRAFDPDVTFCLSTNGLLLPLYAEELIGLGVTHVTVTINAVDPKIGAKIYRFVNYMGTRHTGETGAAILLANQLSGLKYLASRGIVCKVNTVLLKGINEDHVEEVVKKVRGLGAAIGNIMQLIPVEGSAFEGMPIVSNAELTGIRKKCEAHLKQMYHCRQCRADAVGTLDNDLSIEYRNCPKPSAGEKSSVPALRFAVASKSGAVVDQHFGHAEDFYIYESDGEKVRFIEKRNVLKYCEGPESCRDADSKMDAILSAVGDCSGVLALRIGYAPSKKLEQKGIQIYTTYDRIENAVRSAVKSM